MKCARLGFGAAKLIKQEIAEEKRIFVLFGNSTCQEPAPPGFPGDAEVFRSKVKPASMAHGQLPEKGMKVLISFPPSLCLFFLCLIEAELAFFFSPCQKQEAAFCSQE